MVQGWAKGIAAAVATTVVLAGAAMAGGPAGAVTKILAVGAENQYADVISQIGGHYVEVRAVLSNPNIDPHAFESSPEVARAVSSARLVVQNGLGYDAFMDQIERASPNSSRKVIDVQRLLRLPDTTPNPHLWYSPRTMPAVAEAIGRALTSIDPAHRAFYRASVAGFVRSLRPWQEALASVRQHHGGAPVATTEPVADGLIQAAGLVNRTPPSFEVDVMNGIDPSPQGVSAERGLLSAHQVRVLLYNEQVTDSLTAGLVTLAEQNGIPVVGVYETMPGPRYDYQSWMLAEVKALEQALGDGRSAPKL